MSIFQFTIKSIILISILGALFNTLLALGVTTPPDTTITSNPPASTTSTTATFSFTSDDPTATFGCMLDNSYYALCTSPKTYSGLSVGSHNVSIRATNTAGNTDPSPAVFNWTIIASITPTTTPSSTPTTTVTATPTSTPTTTPSPTMIVTPGSTLAPAVTIVPASPTSRVSPSDYNLKEGDVISADGDPDVYIVNQYGFKRLFVNPKIFNLYGHLSWGKIKKVSPKVRDVFVTSGLFRNCESGDKKVYGLDVVKEDAANLRWINTTGEQAVADSPNFFNKVFCMNSAEEALYGKGFSYKSVLDVPTYSR